MRLVKGGKSELGSNVVAGNFSSSEKTLFYSRTFYELPVAGLLIQVAAENTIVDANKLAVEATGISAGELIGSKIEDVFDLSAAAESLIVSAGLDCGNVNGPQEEVDSDGAFTVSIKGGGRGVQLFGVNSLKSNEERFLILMFRLLKGDAHNDSGKRSSALNVYDQVTGLPNTVGAERKLEALCSALPPRSKDFVVAIFSLEGWQREVEHFPPDLADELVSVLADRLKVFVSDGVFIARYRRDEFLVLVYGRADFRRILDKIFTEATREIITRGFTFQLPVKAGICVREIWDAMLPEELLSKARKAVSRARSDGRSNFIVHSQREKRYGKSVERDVLEVVDAFRRNEFCLHFQPVLSLHSGSVQFAEGLLRWRHPSKGIQRPVDFLGSIERYAIFDEIELWVLDLALTTLESWQCRGISINLCINMTARPLANDVFLERALAVCSNYPDDIVKRLSIDITSLEYLEDYRSLEKPLRDLRVRGIRFAIDDFGEGGSRILSSPLVPIDSIKIGQSYVSGLENDLGAIFIVKNIVSFAEECGVEVVAKGVETSKQYKLLKAMGCSGGQGYGISKPLTEDDLIKYLREHGGKDLSKMLPEQRVDRSDLYSFALTEHKLLLREILNQVGRDNIALPETKNDLKSFLEAVERLERNLCLPSENKSLEEIKQSVKRMIDEVGEQDGTRPSAKQTLLKEAIIVLSELIHEAGSEQGEK
ncbi:bifunctional diguanylate cyclase/phosphodiesterase [Marinobacter sp.]|uniref:bifunctional diguanylate cyclase/phosphodiesterase n=1 Tax=Marinobacter sp. TaxID=50741 RepID=UPI0019AD0FCF|nr:bifunctional diguanylate cyclase/phosphodiesterase [Marinobacter sp.]MBD3657101.1 GGDEF domain-containing protein [Marinobacter sp.]